jgi:hypothetical protein
MYVDTSFRLDRRNSDVAGKPKIPITSLKIMGEKAYGLTPRQEIFAKTYATENVTQTEAARRAGFSNPSWAASRLMNGRDFPHVLRRVVELKQELSRKYEVTFENHVKKMAEIRDMALADKNYASAVAAEKARGQVAGLYIARHEIMIGKIDQMSREEVLAEIKKLQEEYPVLAASTAPKQEITPLIEDADFEVVEEPVSASENGVGYESDSEDLEYGGGGLEESERRDDGLSTLDAHRGPRGNRSSRS